MKMKEILLLHILITIGTSTMAQNPQSGPGTIKPRGNGRIFGSVKDSTNQQHAVEFANIALIDPMTGKPIDGTLCDEKGKFTLTKLAPGHYTVSISFLGYATKTIKDVVITDKKTEVNLGAIVIGQSAKVLNEVVIEGQKTLVEEKVDRTIYNAENDMTAKGGDATDVLKRVPMLSVDMDGNVSLRGSQNIKVLINNKPSTITASSVADALKQIPADQIKTVEVITSPSAKYDAESSAGIINIITKKNTMQGFSLNVDGSSGYRGSNLSLNGGYRKGKMGFSLGGFGRAGYNINGTFQNNQTTIRDTIRTLNQQNASTRSDNIGGNYTLGWDYDINKSNNLTASVRFGGRGNNAFQNLLRTQSFTYFNDILAGSAGSTRNVKTTDLSNTLDMNLTYTRTFAKPQQEFSLMALFSRNNRTNDFGSSTLNIQEIDSLRTKNINNSYNQEIAVQADYQTPIGTKQLLEIGGKNTTRTVSSNYGYFVATAPNGIFTPFTPSLNPQQASNIFSYNQNVAAGYFSYTFSLPSGFSIKAGSRYEYTTIDARFKNISTAEGGTNIPAYGVLVPSVNFSKKLKNGTVLKVAYNRRIQRPSIQFLNPNQQFSNQLNVSQGNTQLGPEYTNNYELTYSKFVGGSSFTVSTFARNTNNSIQSIREPYKNSRDTVLTTYKNIGKEAAYGVNIFAAINVSNKFTLNGGGDFYYAVLNNNVADPNYNTHNEGWAYSLRMFGNYTIGKGWAAQFFGFYRGRQVQLQGFQGGFRVYGLSFRKDLPNKKGSIGFGADNFITPSLKIVGTTKSLTINQQTTTVFNNLNFKISFSYRIGKMSFDAPRKRKKSISSDDLKDGGDNGTDNSGTQQAAPQGNGGQRGQQGVTPGQDQKPKQGQGARPGQGGWQKPDSLKQKRDTTGQKQIWRKLKIDSAQQKKDSVNHNQGSLNHRMEFAEPKKYSLDIRKDAFITEQAWAILHTENEEKYLRKKKS